MYPGSCGGVIERRREEQNQPVRPANQVAGRPPPWRACARAWLRGAADDSPRLRDGIDAAFGVRGRAERRAVIVVGAAIPFAVPAVALERGFQRADVQAPGFGALVFAARVRDLGELPENRVQKPAEPDAFAFASLRRRDSCRRSSRPCPSSGRPCAPTARLRSSARAQCSKSVALVSETRGSKYDSFCPSASRSPSRNGTISSRTVDVAGGFDELDHGVGQPQQIVGHARANAAAGRRMPPVLHVAFDKLAAGGAQHLLARHILVSRRTAPLHPATDRGSHTLRLIDRTRRAPTRGSASV